MSQVVADVSKYTATEDSRCHVPVPVEDGMGELVERCCKSDKERRRHNQS